MDSPVVVIAGGGPVGLTAAMELASRGVYVLVVEPRAHAEPPSVKCNHISARSMEIFRRLGVAEELRGAGLGGEHAHDCAYRTTFVGQEIGRTRLPSPAGRARGEQGADTWWPTPEPPHRINQRTTEPILTRHAAAMAGVQIRNRARVEAFEQNADSVRVTIRDIDTDAVEEVSAQFLLGCDGPGSTVRKLIGAQLEGPPIAGRVQSTLIRAPGLAERQPIRAAWTTVVWNPRRCGAVISIDGRDEFLVHNPVLAAEESFDSVDREWALRTILGVDDAFPIEILSVEDFIGRGLVADRFRNGRVFLAGDAAHLWMPFAGYGMNAGIADASDLAWMLAAYLGGWAPIEILEAYERERQPVTGQVMHHAMGFIPQLVGLSAQTPAEIEDDTPEGAQARLEFGLKAEQLNEPQFAAAGLNFGYFYDNSPVIVYDGQSAPAYTMGTFESSTAPGARAPHVWLNDETSLYDLLGDGYGIVRRDSSVGVDALLDAMRSRHMPVSVVDLDGAPEGSAYDRALVLVRPDRHVAWRGDAPPEDPDDVVDTIRGAKAR